MVDFDVAYDKLASLKTADEIANLLSGYGVKGFRADAQNCPISKWMASQTGEEVITSPYYMRILDKISEGTVKGSERPLTSAMQHFVMRFDGQEYPELEYYNGSVWDK